MKPKYNSGPAKNYCRDYILNLLLETYGKAPITGLTLPSSECVFEVNLLKEVKRAKLFCVEKDDKIYRKGMEKFIKTRVSRNRVNHLNLDVFDFLECTDFPLDFMWLDLCGPITERLINYLKNYKLPDIFILTILEAREQKNISRKLKNQSRESLLTKLVEHPLSGVIRYQHTDSPCPMGVYIFNKYNKDRDINRIELIASKTRIRKVG